MEKYGFFGGSFNPVTNAHLNLAKLILDKYDLDKVVFVPVGDKYKKQELASEKHRYEMLKIASEDYDKIEVSDVELNLEKALTTLEAFQKIEKEYREVKPYFIIGADNIFKMIENLDFEILAQNYEYIIIERNDIRIKELITSNPILNRFSTHFHILEDNPYEQISSTKVRMVLKNEKEKEAQTMIPKKVYEYIKENKLY